MSLGILGIDHVQIAVPKACESEALRFYREIVALPEIPKPEELRSRGGAWFQAGNLQMHVGVDPDAGPQGTSIKSKRHICFLVADLAAAKAHIVKHGVAIEEESVAEGLARFFIRDPAGNRIEIGQRA
jgi:catechol 2,3-dioxygenase-like lactoylglutathione lyase family enzyme